MSPGPEFDKAEHPFIDQFISIGWKWTTRNLTEPSATGRESFRSCGCATTPPAPLRDPSRQPCLDEVICYQRIRKQVKKLAPGANPDQALERAVRDLVDDHIESEGVVDIFKLSGLAAADISILDDDFLQTFKDKPHENLRVKLLAKLIGDEIRSKAARNLAKAKSFHELLQKTLDRYHKRVIDAAAVIQAILEMKKEMDADARRTKLLGLSEDELAFYDAVHENYATVYDEPLLRDLIHDVVQVIKTNLKVDWTESHREEVKASVRAAVKRSLRKRGVKAEDFEPMMAAFLQQAEALWKDWPVGA